MAMPLGFATRVSLFSMRKRIIRTILSLLPCVLLIAIMFIGSTIPNGFVRELDEKVLQKAQDRQQYLVLDQYIFSQPEFTSSAESGPSATTFNQGKYDLATQSLYVDTVYPQQGKKIGAQFKTAEKKNIRFVSVVGEFELINRRFKLKDLKTGKEEELSLERMVTKLKDKRS